MKINPIDSDSRTFPQETEIIDVYLHWLRHQIFVAHKSWDYTLDLKCTSVVANRKHCLHFSKQLQAIQCSLFPYLADELDEPGAAVEVPVGHEARDGGVGHQDVLPCRLSRAEQGSPGHTELLGFQTCGSDFTQSGPNAVEISLSNICSWQLAPKENLYVDQWKFTGIELSL